MIKLANIMSASARDICETKKRQLCSGDDVAVKQFGDDKDMISLLIASRQPR
jgi:hypothetical protein